MKATKLQTLQACKAQAAKGRLGQYNLTVAGVRNHIQSVMKLDAPDAATIADAINELSEEIGRASVVKYAPELIGNRSRTADRDGEIVVVQTQSTKLGIAKAMLKVSHMLAKLYRAVVSEGSKVNVSKAKADILAVYRKIPAKARHDKAIAAVIGIADDKSRGVFGLATVNAVMSDAGAMEEFIAKARETHASKAAAIAETQAKARAQAKANANKAPRKRKAKPAYSLKKGTETAGEAPKAPTGEPVTSTVTAGK